MLRFFFSVTYSPRDVESKLHALKRNHVDMIFLLQCRISLNQPQFFTGRSYARSLYVSRVSLDRVKIRARA